MVFRVIVSERTVGMITRVTGNLLTQKMTFLAVLPPWPMQKPHGLLPKCPPAPRVDFTPTAPPLVFFFHESYLMVCTKVGLHSLGSTWRHRLSWIPFHVGIPPILYVPGIPWTWCVSLCKLCLIYKIGSAMFPGGEKKTLGTWLVLTAG